MTDEPARADSYFVCATPRTGSSLLLGLLESTGVAGRPQAWFRAPDVPLWAYRWGLPRTPEEGFSYAEFVRAALRAGRTGNGVFGAKLMWGTLDGLLAGLAGSPAPDGGDLAVLQREFGCVRFVYLYREDSLAQAVSWLRAEQTHAWYEGGSGEITDPGAPRTAPGRAAYDAAAITALLHTVEEHHAAWLDWFSAHGVRPLTVRYEDLDADMGGVVHGVLAHLGVTPPPDVTIAPRHRRQADGLNEEWIRRYRERYPERGAHEGGGGAGPREGGGGGGAGP